MSRHKLKFLKGGAVVEVSISPNIPSTPYVNKDLASNTGGIYKGSGKVPSGTVATIAEGGLSFIGTQTQFLIDAPFFGGLLPSLTGYYRQDITNGGTQLLVNGDLTAFGGLFSTSCTALIAESTGDELSSAKLILNSDAITGDAISFLASEQGGVNNGQGSFTIVGETKSGSGDALVWNLAKVDDFATGSGKIWITANNASANPGGVLEARLECIDETGNASGMSSALRLSDNTGAGIREWIILPDGIRVEDAGNTRFTIPWDIGATTYADQTAAGVAGIVAGTFYIESVTGAMILKL